MQYGFSSTCSATHSFEQSKFILNTAPTGCSGATVTDALIIQRSETAGCLHLCLQCYTRSGPRKTTLPGGPRLVPSLPKGTGRLRPRQLQPNAGALGKSTAPPVSPHQFYLTHSSCCLETSLAGAEVCRFDRSPYCLLLV